MSGNKRVPAGAGARMRELARPGSWRSLLERKARETAQIRSGQMIGNKGLQFRYAKNPGGGPVFVVSDNTGGRTFAPGTEIMLGRPYEGREEFVMGGPPMGKKGPSRPRRPARRPAPVVANHYVFYDDGVTLFAWLYQDGTYVSERASISSASILPWSIILSDESLLVGDGTVILAEPPNPNTIAVWDVAGEAVYSHGIAAGWTATLPLYAAGFLWWMEMQDLVGGHADTVLNLRLRKATTDLSVVETVSTANAAAGGSSFTHYDAINSRFCSALTEDALIGYVWARPENVSHDPDNDPFDCHLIRFPFDGDDPTQSTFDGNTAPGPGYVLDQPVGIGLPNASGGSTMLQLDPGSISFFLFEYGSSVVKKANDSTSAATEIWSPTIFEDPQGPQPPPGLSASFNVRGSLFHICDSNSRIGKASATNAAVSWVSKATLDPVPEGGEVLPSPQYAFYFGED